MKGDCVFCRIKRERLARQGSFYGHSSVEGMHVTYPEIVSWMGTPVPSILFLCLNCVRHLCDSIEISNRAEFKK